MSSRTMHPDEVEISDDTVRALVADQFPQWRDLPVHRLDAIGTENTIVRLGDDLAARFPRHRADPATVQARLEAETRGFARLADHSPVPAPRPVALGRPGPGYPLPWSVQTWLPGTPLSEAGAGDADGLAQDLAGLIRALRAVDTRGERFSGGGRGGVLRDHDEEMEMCLRRSEGIFDVPRLRRLWAHFRDLPREAPDVMNHGDLIPGNLLTSQGRLAGVLDGGGFGPADPALDLIVGWHVFDDAPREVFRAGVGAGDLDWERAQAWAFEQSMGLTWYYAQTNPTMSRMGHRTLQRILAAGPL